jgi:hypothetical protein
VLIGVGVTQVILTYILPVPGGSINLIVGFVLMAAGLIALSQWR